MIIPPLLPGDRWNVRVRLRNWLCRYSPFEHEWFRQETSKNRAKSRACRKRGDTTTGV